MEVKEIEVTKKEKVYTLTETEYGNLINDSKSYGAKKTKEYICFCWDNYYLKMNLRGAVEFIRELMDFSLGISDEIKNVYRLSFWDWLEKNR